MPGKIYDPRGKANRALLVGVYRYEHAENLPGVKHNLGELYSVLMEGEVFGSEEVVPISPDKRIHFLDRLEEAAEQARGLLLLYFAGHGRLSADGSDLFLAVGESRRLEGDQALSEGVSWKHDVLPKLRHVAELKSVDHIVVILDCCNAGNALEEFKPGALQRGRDRISVLTAVQVNRRIPSGNGHEPTPFTKQLVRLLREGVSGEETDGEADGSRGLVTIEPLAAALRQAMQGQRIVLGDPWEPRFHRAESDRDVLIGVTAGSQERLWSQIRARLAVALGSAFAWVPQPGRLLLPLLATCAVLAAAAGGYGAFQLAGDSAGCPPPVELRLLTDPDTAPTLHAAVDRYVSSAANHDSHGCRRSGISTESPKTTDAVRGFLQSAQWQRPSPEPSRTSAPSASAADGFQPQRDVGSQPDIWIPGSSATYQQVAAVHGPALLKSLGPVAYSPIVLAVPDDLFISVVNSTGSALADLVATLRQRNTGSAVLRADPEYTDTGRLATVGLYSANPGETQAADVTLLEQQAARLSPAARSSYDLMCSLADDRTNGGLEKQAAVLVPEQVMAQFNDPVGAQARLGCDTGTLHARVPEYPSDVGMLDLPFVHVTWQGADRDAAARANAVGSFHDWLTGQAGQQVFTDAGYRGLTAQPGRPAPPAVGSWLLGKGRAVPDPQPIGYDVQGGTVVAALDRYRKARGPGRVLYLVDDSPSMNQAPSRLGLAKNLVSQSLDSLSAQDEYGIRTLPGPGPSAVDHELVPMTGHADPAAVRGLLDGAGIVNREADPGGALRNALGTMRTLGRDGRPQLIVFVTDDEDDNHLSGDDLTRLLGTARTDRIPVDWVSLSPGGCDGGKVGPQIAVSSGGRCLDPRGNRAAELRDDVARVGTGDR